MVEVGEFVYVLGVMTFDQRLGILNGRPITFVDNQISKIVHIA